MFKAYVESIFLYNSELWTLTKTLEDKIDSFQRRLLRKVIRVNWPRTISNESLYDRTHMPFNETSSDTPARQSLRHFVKPVKCPIGRPKTTWLSTVVNDLKEHSSIQIYQNLDTVLQQLEIMCFDRKFWTETVCSTMLSKMKNVHR